ncbi:MAG: phosphohydrolase, partial [Candidatus Firestonebacteria bacterium]|nr:phosphohydrolase [Candidatus Firestonebacteria bacterium]
LDGSGYPDGLKDRDISISVRILTIVDIYDSLTCEKPYRDKIPIPEAIKIMQEEQIKGWLDGDVLEIFLNKVIYSR